MTLPPRCDLDTHGVLNQPPHRGDGNLFAGDPLLLRLLPPATRDEPELATYGAALGQATRRQAARDANRHGPELRLVDPAGRRLDEVAFHPAYHAFMALSAGAGYHSRAWEPGGSHQAHAACVYLASQVEPGHCCPLTMTYAAQPVLRAAAPNMGSWAQAALSRDYDPSVAPVTAKRGATIGMAMTEKQGGSDVRANSTRAARDGDHWRLTGHKWFCSAPMSDAFLTLAQTDAGLGCFLVPRWLEDTRNGIEIQRLKDKLGNRSNASAEIVYRDALALPLGDPGEGVRTIVEMVHHTRLDTAMAPVGLMRAALAEAHHWAVHRTTFQRRLIDQPLMAALLDDLALDVAGGLALALRVARAFDGDDPQDRAFARVGVALAKFLNNKLCPLVVGECMEALGGMGYVEDTALPLLYREAPLNGIWEGSANVICLDILRSLARAPGAAEALDATLDAARGNDGLYDAGLAAHRAQWPGAVPEPEARWFAESAATLLSAAALIEAGHPLAPAFCATRLDPGRGRTRGALPDGAGRGAHAHLFTSD
mgnify:CR=1 FL=1